MFYKKYPNEVHLGLPPFFHVYGIIITLQQLALGRSTLLMKKFSEANFLSTIQTHKITHLYLVPPLMVILAKSEMVNKYDLTSIKEIFCGGAPLGKDIWEAVGKR